MLILTVLQGPDKGRRFRLPDHEPQLIGRSSEALPLADQTISRRHSELTPDDGRWFINDLESANGTFVNGQRVSERRQLKPGDQIRTGMTLLLFGQELTPTRPHGVRVAKQGEIDSVVEKTVASNDDSMIMAVPEPSEAAVLQLRVIYELTQLIGAVEDRQTLLEKVMDLVLENFQADRGFILQQETPTDRPEPVVVRHKVKPKNKQDHRITVSRTIVQHVMRQREGVLSSNAMTDTRFASGESVQAYGIRSAMCVPIQVKNRLFGVLYIDSQVANYTYTEDQLRLLTAIGVQTAMAVANVELYAERVSRERLAAVGETVASLSHSTKNILQGMRGGADLVELGLKKQNMKVVQSGWDIVARNLDRIFSLTLNMLAYSKQRKPEVEMTSLPKLLEEIVTLVQRQFDAKQVALITDIELDMPPVPIDPSGVHQAVLNLLQNALDAAPAKVGAVSFASEYQASPQAVRIRVGDNGPGIEPDQQRRLFQPFYSTKGLRGTGLGLVVTKKIVEEHGGTIQLDSKPGEGTTFTIELPCSAAAMPASAETHGPETDSSATNGVASDETGTPEA
ncbi:MAG: GAF domain-containing protein [Planctomycetes bacterium]|nr:GAF domain-containing protein [Planctomycetota bacterium]